MDEKDQDQKQVNSMMTQMVKESPFTMNETTAYTIWGAVVITTRAFGKVEIKINSDINRIFLKVNLRRWGKLMPKFVKRYWLRKAEARALEFIPQGWRCLVYYDK